MPALVKSRLARDFGAIAGCERRGGHLVELIEDAGLSAKDMKRLGLQEALRALEAREATALVVAKLDRLSRSMIDFTALMGTVRKQSWALVALDCAVGTSTPTGRRWQTCLGSRQPVAIRGNGFRLFSPLSPPADLPAIATGCARLAP